MIRDIQQSFFNEGESANLVIVSNTISQEPEMISVLQALRPRNFNVILLVCSDKLKHNVVDPGDIATENFDWLWQSILVISLSSTQAKPVLILSLQWMPCEVSITEDEDEDGDGQQTEEAVVKL
ncbi:hypothetical protein Bca52824_087715 [Brassica carinata]|uniref:Uncharacterized protein n=1 Tax=Brassica carinata TaxID=52824 RepID=A0A8X7TN79_BRACI|nr:hypothetical protein Bca52824_087715 [Brassica carinata]